jgi:site-specific recombinase XerD
LAFRFATEAAVDTTRLKEALLRHRFRAGKRKPEQHVFLNRYGKPFEDLRTPFHNAKEAAGLAGDVTPHTCRHTFASRLVMAGVDMATVKELMGHKRIEMTMRYAHLSPTHKAKAVALLVPPAETISNAFPNSASSASSATG